MVQLQGCGVYVIEVLWCSVYVIISRAGSGPVETWVAAVTPTAGVKSVTYKEHWNRVYRGKAADEVSWYQRRPDRSLDMIASSGVSKDAGVIDIGGGASVLIDYLLDDGYTNLAVLDLAGAALECSRLRLGARASTVEWFEADVTSFAAPRLFGIWHDRAVFHFLTAPDDRRGYVAALHRTLKPGGHAIIATFAPDGPPKCSGLDVMRHDERSITAELGPEFALRDVRRETHVTPWESEQRFMYFRFEHLVDPTSGAGHADQPSRGKTV